jgi:hypothetical protein
MYLSKLYYRNFFGTGLREFSRNPFGTRLEKFSRNTVEWTRTLGARFLNKRYLLISLLIILILRLSRRYTKKQYKTFFNLIYFYIKYRIYNNLYGINLLRSITETKVSDTREYDTREYDTREYDTRVLSNGPNKHIYYKEYYFNDNFYRFIISTDFKVIDTLYSATDENNNDITDEIVKYIGPNNDFHNQTLTPLMLGYKMINLTVDDKEFIFNENDVLKTVKNDN